MTWWRSIKHFILEHRLALTVSLLVMLVAVTGWRRLTMSDARPEPSGLVPSGSDFSLRAFTLTLINEQGQPSVTLRAQAMRHHPDQQRSHYTDPKATLYERGEPRWRGQARQGWASDTRQEIILRDEVVMKRLSQKPAQAMTLRTSELHLYPQMDRASSDARVEIQQPGAWVQGNGMTFDLKHERFELKSSVTGRYDIAQ